MKIISDFKDYYDSGMGLGFDDGIVYRRHRRIVEFSQQDKDCPLFVERKNWFGCLSEPMSMNVVTVGFCGRVYGILELAPTTDHDCKDHRRQRCFCYKLEEVDKMVKLHRPKLWDAYVGAARGRRQVWDAHQRRRVVAKWFEAWEEKRDAWTGLFEGERCPIFVGRWEDKQGKLTWSASLKEVDFFKVFDAYSAFQEVAGWLGNQAEPRKPIPAIDDVTMAEIKGFDKHSFRKDKSLK